MEIILKIIVIRIGIWVILSWINPIQIIWLGHVVQTGLELFNNEADVKYEFILGLKKLLLLNSISQTKKKKQTNKQKERKNQNQAYTKVELDLDDS